MSSGEGLQDARLDLIECGMWYQPSETPSVANSSPPSCPTIAPPFPLASIGGLLTVVVLSAMSSSGEGRCGGFFLFSSCS
jgi:hypothetical protein